MKTPPHWGQENYACFLVLSKTLLCVPLRVDFHLPAILCPWSFDKVIGTEAWG